MKLCLSHSELLDQLVDLVASGRPHVAAHRLMGMLDVLVVDDTSVSFWQAELQRHPIGELLAASPQGEAALPHRRLRSIIDRLEFQASRQTREKMVLRALREARSANLRVLLLDDGAQALADRMDTRDGASSAAGEGPFDLVISLNALGWVAPERLGQWLGETGDLLKDGGHMLASCFLPGHPGHGWRALQAGAEPYSHDEAAITAAARRHGLELRHVRDSANCLVWCQLRRCASLPSHKETENGN